MPKTKLTELVCKKCKHTWIPRQEEVRQCPKCKTAWWDKNIIPRFAKENEDKDCRV